jgi:hypothetical protein
MELKVSLEEPTQADSKIVRDGRQLGYFKDRQSFREASLRLDRSYRNGSRASAWFSTSAFSQRVSLYTPNAFDLGLEDTAELDGLQAGAFGRLGLESWMLAVESESRITREIELVSTLSYGFLDPNITYAGELRQFLLSFGQVYELATEPMRLAAFRLGAIYRRGAWEVEAQILQSVAFSLSDSESEAQALRGRAPSRPRTIEDGGRTVQVRVGWRF